MTPELVRATLLRGEVEASARGGSWAGPPVAGAPQVGEVSRGGSALSPGSLRQEDKPTLGLEILGIQAQDPQ